VFHCARESRLVALSAAARPRARRVAQGAVLPGLTRTANSLEAGTGEQGLGIEVRGSGFEGRGSRV